MQLNSFSSILSNLFGQPIFQIAKVNISLLFIVKLGITIIVTFYVIRLLNWFIKYRLLVRLGINKSNREEISLIFSYLAKILGIYFVLEASGFSLSSLTVIVGALGVGIGFGLQNIFNNLVSGVLLLTYPYKGLGSRQSRISRGGDG